VIAAALDDHTELAVMSYMTRAAEILDAPPPEYVVVLPLAWVYLGAFKMSFADVEIQTITEERLTAIRQGFYAIIETTPHTENEKNKLVRDADKLTELLQNRPAAFVSVRGDKDFAKERALKMVTPVVDLMQVAGAIYHQLDDVSIGVGGDLLAKQPPVLIIAKDGSNIHHEGRYAFGHRYEMEAQHLEEMRSKGFGPLLDSLSKPESERTEFERTLLRSMHWVAEAERQSSIESKTTAYVTAIDMFFARQGEPLTRDITEGTATLLSSTLEGRRQVVKVMERFYKLRSGVSHVGEEVTEDDIRGLKGLTISFLARMSAMSSRFATKDAFRSWLVDQRLTPSMTQRAPRSRRHSRLIRYLRRVGRTKSA